VIDPDTPLLLDTNIVLHLCRGGTAAQRLDARYKLLSRPKSPLVSVVTVGEMLAFARDRGWGTARHDALQAVLYQLVRTDINQSAVLNAFADIKTELVRSGRSVSDNDIWIAATAKATGALLLTTDRDFDPLDPSHITREWVDPESLR
jgi:tRNA(fMet)-specific endonuclease VapC